MFNSLLICVCILLSDGDIQIVSNNFALAIQQGRGPVIAQSIVDAKGKSQNLRNAVERGKFHLTKASQLFMIGIRSYLVDCRQRGEA